MTLEERIKTLEDIEEIKKLKQKLDFRISLVNKIRKDKVPVDGLLKVISTIIPESINLDALILEQESHILILKGTVSPKRDSGGSILTDFMEEIETSSFFTEATLISSEMLGGIRYFEISCDLAG